MISCYTETEILIYCMLVLIVLYNVVFLHYFAFLLLLLYACFYCIFTLFLDYFAVFSCILLFFL